MKRTWVRSEEEERREHESALLKKDPCVGSIELTKEDPCVGSSEIVRSNRLCAEGLKEGIGCMPMETKLTNEQHEWRVSPANKKKTIRVSDQSSEDAACVAIGNDLKTSIGSTRLTREEESVCRIKLACVAVMKEEDEDLVYK